VEFAAATGEVGFAVLDDDDLALVAGWAGWFFVFEGGFFFAGPVGGFVGEADGVGGAVEAAGVIDEGRRADSRVGGGAGGGNGGADFVEKFLGEGDGDAGSLGPVVDGGFSDGEVDFFEEKGVGGELEGVVFFGDAVVVFIAAGGAALVVEDFASGSGVFDEVDDAPEAEGIGFEREGAEGSAFGEVEVVLPVGGFIGIAVEVGTGGGVGILNPEVLDPLEVEEALAVGEVVQAPDGHGRVGVHGAWRFGFVFLAKLAKF